MYTYCSFYLQLFCFWLYPQKRLHRQTLGPSSSSLQHHHRQQQSSFQFDELLASSGLLTNVSAAPNEISPSLLEGTELRRTPANRSTSLKTGSPASDLKHTFGLANHLNTDDCDSIPASTSIVTAEREDDHHYHTRGTEHSSPHMMRPQFHVNGNGVDDARFGGQLTIPTSMCLSADSYNNISERVTKNLPKQIFVQPFSVQQPPYVYIDANTKNSEQLAHVPFASQPLYEHVNLC